MDPATFLQLMMAEYEQQWVRATGHQQRHPLRVKMRRLQELIERKPTAEELDRLLLGEPPADPEACLLCEDLAPYWRRLRSAPAPAGSNHSGQRAPSTRPT